MSYFSFKSSKQVNFIDLKPIHQRFTFRTNTGSKLKPGSESESFAQTEPSAVRFTEIERRAVCESISRRVGTTGICTKNTRPVYCDIRVVLSKTAFDSPYSSVLAGLNCVHIPD